MVGQFIPDMTERYPEGLSTEFVPDAEYRAWKAYERDLQKDWEMEAAGFVFDRYKGWYKPVNMERRRDSE